MPSQTKDQIAESAFAFLKVNERAPKPRKCGVTEIRGPYYTPLGKRQLEDILETMGNYVDALKFAGGSFGLQRDAVHRASDGTKIACDAALSAIGIARKNDPAAPPGSEIGGLLGILLRHTRPEGMQENVPHRPQ